jgi:hypothetical protein
MKTRTPRTKIPTLLLLVSLVCPALAVAQHDGMGQGYLFGAAGKPVHVSRGTQVGAGIGFERLFGPGIGVGAELQGYGVNGGSGGYGGIRFTANGSYHFRASESKLVPLVTAGFTGDAVCSGGGCGGLSGFNFGGGVNYWIKPNRGLRLEFRDHVLSEYGYARHAPEFRVGFAF